MARAPGAALAFAATLAACGATPGTSPPPWAASHPAPPGLHFADATGICAITVRYPNQAPGEIDYSGTTYIQRDRLSASSTTTGSIIGRSADWTISQPSPSTLLLTAGATAYTYRSGSNCGSNEAPPS